MPDREVNAETRVSDEKEAAVRRAEAIRRAIAASGGVWKRIEELERDNERLRDDLRYLATRLRYDAPTTVYSAQRIAEWAAEQLLALAETPPSGETAQ